MAKQETKLSEILENEWVESIVSATNGIIIVAVAGLFWYLVKFRLTENLRIFGYIFCGIALFLGLLILFLAGRRSYIVSKIPRVAFRCPYCDADNFFTEPPTEDFDCDHCHRTVHFRNGAPLPVRTIVCPFCRTQHRVSEEVERFVCDRCNRLLKIGGEAETPGRRAVGTASVDEHDALMQNYDVLVVAIDRRRENEIAFKLQNLMVVNLPEARRLIGTISQKTPLIVGHNLPQRKADAIRRQLQDLGATATLRSTASAARPAQKAR